MADIWNESNMEQGPQSPKPDPLPASSADRPLAARGIPYGSGLGKYRILDRVRTTPQAIIYNARDALLDRLVVIKQLNPSLVDDPLACGDFKREAQLLARIPKDSRNVIGVHELIGDDQGLFLVEEFVAGDWLEVLVSKRKVGLADALRLLKYACLGLRSIHSRKVVHRDIHPANLLVSPNGQVRIGNFSCAAREGDHTPPHTIHTKYAAPELQLGSEHDDRVDIYSLGMVIYEVCVGRRALNAQFASITRDPAAAAERWRQWHIDPSALLPSARSLNPSVPPALAMILHKMTTKDTDERYSGADEVLQDIVRRFSAARQNVARALPGAAVGQLVDQAAPPMPAALPTVSQPTSAQPQSLLHLASGTTSATTHTVKVDPVRNLPPANSSVLPKPALTPPAPQAPPMSIPRPAPTGIRPNASPRPRTVATAVRPLAPPTSIPIPTPAVEPPKKRRPILVPALVVILLGVSAYLATSLWKSESAGTPAQKRVWSLIDESRKLYFDGEFQEARGKIIGAMVRAEGNSELVAEHNQADALLILIEGQLALQQNDFDKVDQLLSDAETRGADVDALLDLRTKFKAKREALKLASEGARDIEDGRLVDAEYKVTDYEANAKVAGLDSSALKDRVRREREDRDYDKALERARKALAENDFNAATLACRDAQAIRVTAATRQLMLNISDAKSRYDWMIRGDKAMKEQDYAAAESAYLSAIAIDPSVEVEQKLKMASSMRLFNEARDDIAAGDLLGAKKKLENSNWKYPNRRARAKLMGLAKAFEAAQLVANGDRELEKGNVSEAIRLYEKALPDLVAPADEMAKVKLLNARLRASQPATGG